MTDQPIRIEFAECGRSPRPTGHPRLDRAAGPLPQGVGPVTPETLVDDIAHALIESGRGAECPRHCESGDGAQASCAECRAWTAPQIVAVLEHLDSLALIRWPWDAACRDLHRYRDSPGGLMCMRRRGHDGKHRQGDVAW